MRIKRGVTMVTGVLMGSAVLAAGPAQAAEAYSEQRLIARADVDGDGKRDSVIQTTTWSVDGLTATTTVTVKGSTKRTSSVRWSVNFYAEFETPWVGVGIVDGKPGYDLAVDINDNEDERYRMYTWRSGRLVSLAPPESRSGARTAIWKGMSGENPGGYRFYTSRGVRYVERLVGTNVRDYPRREFRATFTTYKWSKDGWVLVKTRRTTLPAYEKNIRPWMNLSGTGMKMPW